VHDVCLIISVHRHFHAFPKAALGELLVTYLFGLSLLIDHGAKHASALSHVLRVLDAGAQLVLLDGVRIYLFGEALGEVEQQWLAQQINAHLEANLGTSRSTASIVDDEAPGLAVSVVRRLMVRWTDRQTR
jgi:hypothetical protein